MSEEIEKTFFVISRDEPAQYSKFKSALENDGWTHVIWLQDFATLRSKLDDLNKSSQNYDGVTLGCLAPINPPAFRNRELDFILDLIELICSLFANGSLLLVGGDGDNVHNNNGFLNNLLARLKFNVRFRRDNVFGMSPLSMDPDKLYHPKEVKLSSREDQFIVNRGLSQFIHEQRGLSPITEQAEGQISMLYPHGCTLRLMQVGQKSPNDSIDVAVMMTSGQAKNCLPKNQPICAFYDARLKPQANQMSSSTLRMVALGSSKMLTNHYIDLEDNLQIISSFINFLSKNDNEQQQHQRQSLMINLSDASTLELEPEFHYTPHIESILDHPLMPMATRIHQRRDDSVLFDSKLFNLDNSMVGKIRQAYEDLGVERGPLSLIKPQFERQSLPLEPAVHKFLIRRL